MPGFQLLLLTLNCPVLHTNQFERVEKAFDRDEHMSVYRSDSRLRGRSERDSTG
jgi:hypothetical protein